MAAKKNNFQIEPKSIDLDTFSIVYPALQTKDWNEFFRNTAVLKKDIQPLVLAKAINDLKERFPNFYVQLKRGFFKYTLVCVKDTDVLTPENDFPCRPFTVGSGGKPMFRVLYASNRLSLEIYHAVTDGGGAICFFKNILARYMRLLGYQFDYTDGVLDINEKPKESETEDAFKKLNLNDIKRVSRSEDSAYQYVQINKDNLKVIHGLISVDALKKLTKAKGVTITEYLTAVFIYAFYKDLLPNKSKRPIKICVPADLRRLFGSNTLRNFSLYANIGIHPNKRDYTFDEILVETAQNFKEGFSKETLSSLAITNIADANHIFLRCAPIFLRNVFIRIGFDLFSHRTFTSALSNVGIVTLPKGLAEQVEHFEFVLGNAKKSKLECGTVTFGNVMDICFTSLSNITDIQRLFFTHLTEQGINVSIQSNIQNGLPWEKINSRIVFV
ncbi:MAG: hypothetical protein WCN92_05570 [Eubacteriales bacterium]